MENREMELMNLLKEKQLSVYQCAKESHVPYTTLSDIVKGKTRIEKCTAETIYKLARTLHLTVEELLTKCFKEDENAPNLRDFEIYKSNICHLVKDKGDIDFIIDILKENQIKQAGQEAGADAGAMEGCSLLACLPWLAQPALL